MKKYKALDAVGYVDEKLIEKTEKYPKSKNNRGWVKWCAAAACLCVAAVGAAGLIRTGVIGFGSSASSPGGDYGGGSEGSVYMSYAGPVFPLSSLSGGDNLTVQRNIDFDFSPYITRTESYEDDDGTHYYEEYSSKSIITDSYVLANPDDEAQTVTLIYPFAADLLDASAQMPKITVDGERAETSLHIGPYCGGFRNASGKADDTAMMNLAGLNSWEDYKEVIEGDYLPLALDVFPELAEPVTVYELSNIYGEKNEKANAPTLNLAFKMDFSRTTALTYGFNGGSNDIENGKCERSFFIPQSFNPDYGESKYLIVLGDDIEDLTVKGYTNGGCETPIDNAGADVARYKSTLGEMIAKTAAEYLLHSASVMYGDTQSSIISCITRDTFFGLISEMLCDYGMLSDSLAERYSDGMLDFLYSDVCVQGRIMYITFDVTVPENGTAEVSARFEKPASIDFIGDGIDRNGYDMLTILGSSLVFSGQTASVSNTENIELIRDNFGFDLKNGITDVVLDTAQEHYYIEVRHIGNK